MTFIRPGSLARLVRTVLREPALAFSLVGLVSALLPAASAQAQIRPDVAAPTSLRPGVSVNSNGTSVVYIQTPSPAGVSRNVYSQFDVGAPGVVLNNSATGSRSWLAGQVGGNAALSRGPARVILNEVNSSAPSDLRGTVEVAGNRAEVVIANPSGISCDGCGFINASRVTLATTRAVAGANGAPGSLEVGDGVVRIGPGGMNTLAADYTDILSRAVEINGRLAARRLTMVGVLRPGDIVSPYNRTGVVIDVSALGSIYADSIRIVGTEAGMGVREADSRSSQPSPSSGTPVPAPRREYIPPGPIIRNAGSVVARTGDLTITTSGQLVNDGTLRSVDGSVLLQGLAVSSVGSIAAGRSLGILGSSVRVGGLAVAGLSRDGSLSAEPERLHLEATELLDVHGSTLLSSGDLVLRGANASLSRAKIYATDLLDLRITGVLEHDHAFSSAGQLQVEAHDLTNDGGTFRQRRPGTASLLAHGEFDGRNGSISSQGHLRVSGGTLRMQGATTVAADGIEWFRAGQPVSAP